MLSQIDKLQPIAPIKPLETEGGTAAAAEGEYSFGDVFRSAVDYVKETDAEKTELQYQLSVGELDNPALLTIASTKNSIAVELLVQLRNQALDAYNEIMRISY